MRTERRQHARQRVHIPAYASIDEGSRRLILDANEYGLAIYGTAPIPVWPRVNVKLDLVGTAGRLVMPARVAWSDAGGRVGIEFLDHSTEIRPALQEWLKNTFQSAMSLTSSTFEVHSFDEGTIAPETSLDSLLSLAAERAVLLTCADAAAIALNDNRGIFCRAATGEIAPPIGSQIDPHFGLTGECLRSAHVVWCDDTDSDPQVNRESCRRLGIGSLIVAPIVNEGSAVGLIAVFSRRPRGFETSDCCALERLTDTVATLITNGRLNEVSTETCSQVLQTAEVSGPEVCEPRPSIPLEAKPAASDDQSPLNGIPLSSGYQVSMIHKLVVHRRAVLWPVAAILVALSTWFSFKPSQQRWSNRASSTNSSLYLEGVQKSSSSVTPTGASATPVYMNHDFEEVRQRAEGGDTNAQLELGAMYASGQHNKESDTEAVNWLTRSANAGNATAAAALGAFYWDGRGVTQGYVNAYTWSTIAAAEGDDVSSYRATILRSRMSQVELDEAERRTAAWLRAHRKQIGVKGNASTIRWYSVSKK